MHRVPFYRLVAIALVTCCWIGSSTGVRACSLDQKPSMSADKQLAHITTQVPTTTAQLAVWSYFVFPHSYARRHVIVLAENLLDVARTLSAEAMRQPWAWQFGDGRIAYGRTVRHAYTQRGRWRIKVYVWDPLSGRWDLFDQATIRVT